LGCGAGFIDREGLVVPGIGVVAPDGFPFGAVYADGGVVGDDVDGGGLVEY